MPGICVVYDALSWRTFAFSSYVCMRRIPIMYYYLGSIVFRKSNRKAINRNWSNQKANSALKTKTGNTGK